MKEGIHPDYRYVVFEDESAGFRFLSRSTVKTNDKTQWTDGNTYPLYKLEISSASHPFFTGKQKLMDTAGRVDRFRKRYGQAGQTAAG
ncbi:MAG: type B 50S ribosomal protein L31 [Myxococcales bacterium]|jgi:large subunit ribosomal protein L31|nr:type B 50S ribosomal protein L31 [Myxococcales bacterium]